MKVKFNKSTISSWAIVTADHSRRRCNTPFECKVSGLSKPKVENKLKKLRNIPELDPKFSEALKLAKKAIVPKEPKKKEM